MKKIIMLAGFVFLFSCGENIQNLVESADNGDAASQYLLAQEYSRQQELDKAFIYYEKAAAKKYKDSEIRVALYLYIGEGCQKDIEKSFDILVSLADQGDLKAQEVLGLLKMRDSLAESIYWYEKAAMQGSVIAQGKLGRLYDTGAFRGDKEYLNKEKAKIWYAKAALNGCADSSFHLAIIYLFYGQFQFSLNNQERVFSLLEFSAGKGHSEAQYYLGLLYLVYKNEKKYFKIAEKLLTASANQHYKPAQKILAYLYFDGNKIPKNYKKSFKWFNLLDFEDKTESTRLAYMYANGLGSKEDIDQAISLIKSSYRIYRRENFDFLLSLFLAKKIDQDSFVKICQELEISEDDNIEGIFKKVKNSKKFSEPVEFTKSFEFKEDIKNIEENIDYRLALVMNVAGFISAEELVSEFASETLYPYEKRINSCVYTDMLNKFAFYNLLIEKNYDEYLKIISISANLNDSYGNYYLGKHFFEKNQIKLALKYLSKSFELGNREVAFFINEKYSKGKISDKQYLSFFVVDPMLKDLNLEEFRYFWGVKIGLGVGVLQSDGVALNLLNGKSIYKIAD